MQGFRRFSNYCESFYRKQLENPRSTGKAAVLASSYRPNGPTQPSSSSERTRPHRRRPFIHLSHPSRDDDMEIMRAHTFPSFNWTTTLSWAPPFGIELRWARVWECKCESVRPAASGGGTIRRGWRVVSHHIHKPAEKSGQKLEWKDTAAFADSVAVIVWGLEGGRVVLGRTCCIADRVGWIRLWCRGSGGERTRKFSLHWGGGGGEGEEQQGMYLIMSAILKRTLSEY